MFHWVTCSWWFCSDGSSRVSYWPVDWSIIFPSFSNWKPSRNPIRVISSNSWTMVYPAVAFSTSTSKTWAIQSAWTPSPTSSRNTGASRRLSPSPRITSSRWDSQLVKCRYRKKLEGIPHHSLECWRKLKRGCLIDDLLTNVCGPLSHCSLRRWWSTVRVTPPSTRDKFSTERTSTTDVASCRLSTPNWPNSTSSTTTK